MRKLIYLYIFLTGFAYPPTSWADRRCVTLLALLHLELPISPPLQRLLIRDPNRTAELGNDYVQNVREALEVFNGWFTDPHPTLSYAEMLREMHRRIAVGKDGTRKLVRDKDPTFWLAVQNPGLFRHELPVYLRGRLYWSMQILKLTNPLLAGLRARGIELPPAHQIDGLDFLYSDVVGISVDQPYPVRSHKGIGWRTHIEGIPEEALPYTVDNALGYYTHFYPDPKYIPLYLERMRVLMEKLRAIDKVYQARGKLPEGWQDVLSDYYHVANTLPFLRINNSWAMGHVNIILLNWGKNGISHGELDIDATFVDYLKFREHFARAVHATNPGR